MRNIPEPDFHVSPFLNLYYSLEVSTGTIPEEYNREYANRMKAVFPGPILQRFKELHDRQRFSWRAKACLGDMISEDKLRESMLMLAGELKDLLAEGFSLYQTYWKEIEPNLISAREALTANKGELEALLGTISESLQTPWKIEDLHIQLVDPFTGEPIGKDAIALGIGSVTALPAKDLTAVSYFFILHEAAHILVWDTVRNIAEKYTTEEHAEYIDEAVMNLICQSAIKHVEGFSERFRKAIEEAKKRNFPPTLDSGKPDTP